MRFLPVSPQSDATAGSPDRPTACRVGRAGQLAYHRPVQVLRVMGGARLSGEVSVVGAKNSVLKLMSAALLTPGLTRIDNLPAIADVAVMRQLLEHLGCTVTEFGGSEGTEGVAIDVPEDVGTVAPYELVRRIRASICVLGPLLTRTGEARVAMPGGDNIGSRKLDMHLLGLQRLGASVELEHGFIVAKASRLHGASIWLDFPSVGATENLLTAAVLARGTTVIDNAAREPEIVDLCQMLVAMGARIDGMGSSTLEIQGVDELRPVAHTAVADRIVAGTWAFGAVMTQGDVRVRGARAGHLSIALDKLAHCGASVIEHDDGFRVVMDERPRAFDVVTLPYPGFPTDLQPQAIALLSVADGASMVTENLFDGRFQFCDELIRMGADLRTDGHHALVRGRPQLSAAPVRATDIRAGVGLVLAGLVADGVTEIGEIHHIDRGYVRLEEQLRQLGAQVERVESDLF
jgi:UDP-N-acetylglucosamine 1-carboxyvinyltransferase